MDVTRQQPLDNVHNLVLYECIVMFIYCKTVL